MGRMLFITSLYEVCLTNADDVSVLSIGICSFAEYSLNRESNANSVTGSGIFQSFSFYIHPCHGPCVSSNVFSLLAADF